jgi:hypothetical protein
MTTQLEQLHQLYDFDSWRDARRPEESLFLWRFRLSGGEIEGWKAYRIQRLELGGAPPANISLWRPGKEDLSRLLAIDIYEAQSRAAAREHLLRLLGEFQGPPLKRREVPGEVAFVAGETAVLFARANVAVFVRSVDRDPAPAAAMAAQLDRYIGTRPLTVERGGPQISALRPVKPGAAAPGRPVVLTIEAAGPDRGSTWFKLFSRSGDFRMEQGGPAYVAAGAGPHEITVYAIGASGAASSQSLRLD